MEQTQMKAALINRTWFDAARAVLNTADRCCLYDTICAYTFGLPFNTAALSAPARAMWEMIHPYLDADKDKYTARCERNRKNASRSQSQPVAASRSQSQPVDINNNTNIDISNSNNTNINNNNNNNSFSLEQNKKDIFNCKSIFFARGCSNIQKTFDAFWNYYESQGWKSSKGAPIVSRAAAARMWRCDDIVPDIIELRRPWYEAFKVCEQVDLPLWTCAPQISVDSDVLTISTSMQPPQLEMLEKECERALVELLTHYNCHIIDYKCRK